VPQKHPRHTCRDIRFWFNNNVVARRQREWINWQVRDLFFDEEGFSSSFRERQA
jgi:hypothetical protein